MTQQLIPFAYGETPVRVVQMDGEPWFVAADIAKVLGYREAYDLTRGLDDDEKGPQIVRTPGGEQEMTTISEAGLYSAILRSRVDGAKAFKRWVIHEVIPSIRKTGSYGAAPKQLTEEEIVHQALQITARKVEELEARVEILTPPAKAWEDLASASGDYSVGDAAKVLSRAGIKTGQNRLFATLSELGWTFRRSGYWQAMQTAVDQGLVVERVRPPRYDQLTGEQIAVAPQIRLTAKAIEKLRTQLGGTRGGALIAVSS